MWSEHKLRVKQTANVLHSPFLLLSAVLGYLLRSTAHASRRNVSNAVRKNPRANRVCRQILMQLRRRLTATSLILPENSTGSELCPFWELEFREKEIVPVITRVYS